MENLNKVPIHVVISSSADSYKRFDVECISPAQSTLLNVTHIHQPNQCYKSMKNDLLVWRFFNCVFLQILKDPRFNKVLKH